MIPHSLSLTNFMCYRRATVDFAGIHVACLSGENGAGKSALLDAMTWAVWGKARARRDDELIRLGEDEMAVDFVFGLGDERYRVVRTRKAGKRGQSQLDIQIRDGERWRSIAESTIRDTQVKIEHALRLDYDTFINSAFLRQGQADEFTVKTPAERKRVLGNILGLDVWESYEEHVKGALRTVQDEIRALDLRLAEIEEELARRPDYEAQVAQAQADVAEVAAVLRAAEAAWQALESARAALRPLRQQSAEMEARVVQAERELNSLALEREARTARLAAHQEVLAHAAEIEAGYAAYEAALERERALGEKLTAQADLNAQRSHLEARIAETRHALQTERELAAQAVSDLEARRPTPELRQALAQFQAQQAHLSQLREAQEAARNALAARVEQRAALRGQNEALRPEMDALKERIDLLQEAAASCPLCGQPLSEDDRQRLVQELTANGKQMGDTYRANRSRLEAIATEVAALEAQIAHSAPLLQSLPQVEQELARVTEQVRAGEEADAALAAARLTLGRLDAELAAEAYAPELRIELAAVLAQAAELGYDAAAHVAARQTVAAGQERAEQKRLLDAARVGVAQEEAALSHLDENARRWQAQTEADRSRQAELAEEISRLDVQVRDAPGVEAQLTRVRTSEAEARRRLGAAEQRLAACAALAQQKESRRERRQALAHRASLYDDLRAAFGVHGVPAMIIEAVVPEIEAEANRILSRMTAGRMHVRLETQRETLSGTIQETLDIHIMDELGERPYHNYSGGEQFRINFALRIALSRLLARRAGAEMQTLIIDEGFGTQDAQGRTRLVEAIHAIQDEFTRLLVITHIEELQDAFPVRIQVVKTADGSSVEVL